MFDNVDDVDFDRIILTEIVTSICLYKTKCL